MKVLHIYKDFDPPIRGGMERHIALSCRYQREWAEVEALTCSRSIHTRVADRDGTRVTEVGEWGRFQSAPVSPLFPYYLRKIRADVLVVHVPNPTAELGYLLARPPGTLVVRYHSDVVRQASAMRFYRPIQMHFLRKAAIIMPTSAQYVASSAVLSELAGRCVVVPLGVVPEAFENPDAANVNRLREAYGGQFVLFAGKNRYYKGLEYLVRAAPDIRGPVVIAGDGPERERCQRLAAERGAAIHFPGELSQSDLVDHLHACAVVAFPSVARSEAFGIAILEAHVCGKPVVATRLGTGVELANLDGETGFNVPPRDAGALAEAINRLLARPEERRRFGDFARERVLKEFRSELVARREFELYAAAHEGALR